MLLAYAVYGLSSLGVVTLVLLVLVYTLVMVVCSQVMPSTDFYSITLILVVLGFPITLFGVVKLGILGVTASIGVITLVCYYGVTLIAFVLLVASLLAMETLGHRKLMIALIAV